MISLQRSMHSSQMYTPGPAISFFTCFWDLPQNEHLSSSPPSPNLATSVAPPFGVLARPSDRAGYVGCLPRRDYVVDDAVVPGFLGTHHEVAVGVLVDPLLALPGVARQDLVEELAHAQHLPGRQLDVGGLASRLP